MTSRQLIATLYVVVLAAAGLWAGTVLIDMRREYAQLKQSEALSRRKLEEARARLAEQEKILERLRTDPAYVERVIRKKLGYANPQETVFRFEN